MRFTIPLALGAALVASTLTTAQTPNPTPKTSSTSDVKTTSMNPDHHFVIEAADGGMAEVELGQLAADKATNPKVKSFGQQMATDHGKASEELKSIATAKNITLPSAPSAKHKATKDRLSKLSGAAFDRAYMLEMVKDHQLDAAAFRKESNMGKDAEVKAWAAKTLAVVEDHLKMARDIQKEVAAGTAKSTQ
jgi:putative membrane protein